MDEGVEEQKKVKIAQFPETESEMHMLEKGWNQRFQWRHSTE